MLLTLSANVTTTAKVNETARLSATFTPGASLTTDNLKSQTIGFITLSGYKGSPLVRDLSFSDVGGVAKSLSLNGISENDTLYVNTIYDNAMLSVNGGPISGSAQNLSEGQASIEMRTIGSQETVSAGQYTGNVSITLANQ